MAEDYYLNNYKEINISGDVSSVVTRFMHRFLEHGRDLHFFEKVLEVGALNGEHTHFVNHKFSQYYVTDIRSPDQVTIDYLSRKGFKFQLADVENLPFENGYFDRIISTCLLHHLENPKKGIDEILRVVKSGGTVDILVPHDPSIIYSTSWFVTTGIRALLKRKFQESYLNRKSEHINNLKSIESLVQSYNKLHLIERKHFPNIFKRRNLTVLFRFTITKS
jgi:SAM-dependent methyltransferase